MRIPVLVLASSLAVSTYCSGQIAFMGLPFGTDDKVVKAKMNAEGLKCWPQEGTTLSKAANWVAISRHCTGTLMDANAEVTLYYNLKPGGIFKGATPDGGVKKIAIDLRSTHEPAPDLFDRMAKVLTEKYGKPEEEDSTTTRLTRWQDATGSVLRLSIQETTPPTGSYYYHGRHYSPADPVVRYVLIEYLADEWAKKEQGTRDSKRSVF